MGALYVIVLNGVGEDLFFRYQEGERAKSALLFENSSKFVTNLRFNKIFVDNGSYFRLDQSLFVVITTKIARKQRNTLFPYGVDLLKRKFVTFFWPSKKNRAEVKVFAQ